jgi:hypothetical protein
MDFFSIEINVYLFILLDIISALFPGDGCCIRWEGDGTCCIDFRGQCCGNGGFGRGFGFDHRHHGPNRQSDVSDFVR